MRWSLLPLALWATSLGAGEEVRVQAAGGKVTATRGALTLVAVHGSLLRHPPPSPVIGRLFVPEP